MAFCDWNSGKISAVLAEQRFGQFITFWNMRTGSGYYPVIHVPVYASLIPGIFLVSIRRLLFWQQLYSLFRNSFLERCWPRVYWVEDLSMQIAETELTERSAGRKIGGRSI